MFPFLLIWISFLNIWDNGIWEIPSTNISTSTTYLKFTDPGSGSNCGIYVGNPPNLDNIDSAITIFTRVKGITGDGGPMLILCDNYYLFLDDSSDKYNWKPDGVATLNKSYPPNPYDGSWHTVAVTYDSAGGANNIIIQIDGTDITRGTKTGDIPTGGNSLWIGNRNGNAYHLNAYMSNLQIYSRILDSTEIAWLHDNPDSVYDTTALHLWYPMNEGVGDTVYDYSNYANHGSIRLEVEWVTE